MATPRKTALVATAVTIIVLAGGHFALGQFEHAIEFDKTKRFFGDAVWVAKHIESYRKLHGSYPIASDWQSLNGQIEAYVSFSGMEEALTYVSNGTEYVLVYYNHGWGPFVLRNGSWVSCPRIINENRLRESEETIASSAAAEARRRN